MKTRTTARRHHYLPLSYLAGFTDNGTKNSQFFVLDVHTGHSFRTTPNNVAVERDFNRIDIEGQSSDAIEQALASLEEQAAQAIQNVIELEEFPEDKDYNFIMNLLGLIAVHNPQLRKSFNLSRKEVMNRIADLLVSDKRIWNHHVRKAREAGEEIDDNVRFEDVKRFVEERRYRMGFLTEGNLRVEFRAFDKLLPILGQRIWSLIVAPVDGPEFICSDHPVTLAWKNKRDGPVGYGLKKTEVFFPLAEKSVSTESSRTRYVAW
jgi:hypothetical protein